MTCIRSCIRFQRRGRLAACPQCGKRQGGQLRLGSTSNYGDNAGETPAAGGAVELGGGVTIAVIPTLIIDVPQTTPPVVNPPVVTPPVATPPFVAPGNAIMRPGKVRGLKVKGKASAAKRTIMWRAPKVSGGAPVISYRVAVRAKVKGRLKVIWSKKVTVPTTAKAKAKVKIKVKRNRLRAGSHRVRVRAINTQFKGAWTNRGFKVVKN